MRLRVEEVLPCPTQVLSVSLYGTVRTDASAPAAASLTVPNTFRLVSSAYNGAFTATPPSLTLAVTAFNTMVVAPKVVAGVLPTDK